jgi:hypothetical protein
MDDSLGVGGIERIGKLNAPLQETVERDRSKIQAPVQGLAFQQLHGDERLGIPLSLDFFDRINGADVGMVQRRCGPRLQQKTVERILIARKSRRQKLQRNTALQVEILRFINDPHAAAAQLAGNAVMRDGLADHE